MKFKVQAYETTGYKTSSNSDPQVSKKNSEYNPTREKISWKPN
jgi:hypothetical protein